jgi:hypothetical protein
MSICNVAACISSSSSTSADVHGCVSGMLGIQGRHSPFSHGERIRRLAALIADTRHTDKQTHSR